MTQPWTVREKFAVGLTVLAGAATLLVHTPVNASHTEHGAHMHEATSSEVVSCAKAGVTKTVTLTSDGIEPVEVTLKACDTLKMRNQDTQPHALALAATEGHRAYEGFGESTIQPGATRTFQLKWSGHYVLHDHHDKTFKATVHVE